MTTDSMTPDGRRPVRRALLSVSDKAGLRELALGLHAAGVQLVSTGTTATVIAEAGVPVTPVEELTGFPECLDGRVKTLHPRVHAGLLADTRQPAHLAQLAAQDIEPFELLVVNLYPFEATVASGAGFDQCVEQIDVGGPAMVRGAAKNHASVAVVVDPAAYGDVLDAVRTGGFTPAQRRALALTAFRHTADYDIAVASWLGSVSDQDGFPGLGGRLLAAGGGVALRGEPAPAGRVVHRRGLGRAGSRAAAARQGDVLQQLHRRRRGLAGRP